MAFSLQSSTQKFEYSINKRNTFSKRFKKTLSLQLMIIVPIIIFFIFAYFPIYGIIIAFQNFNMKEGFFGSEWVGLEHFISLIENPKFLGLFKNTMLLGLYGILWITPATILLAILINEAAIARFKKIAQVTTCLPNFLSTVTVVGMIYLLFSPTDGIINLIITRTLNIEPIYFTATNEWYRTLFVGSNIWQHTGFGAIYYLAALASIDTTLYEAANIDGATRLQKIIHIDLPSLLPTAAMLTILSMGNVLNVDTGKAILMFNPLNSDVSDIVGTYMYRRGLLQHDYSSGAAIGLIFSLVNFICLYGFNWISGKITKHSIW